MDDRTLGQIIEIIIRGTAGAAIVFGLAALAGAGIGLFLRSMRDEYRRLNPPRSL